MAERKKYLLIVLFLCNSICSFAQKIETATPESAGFSSQRLKRIDEAMKQWVDKGWMQGGSGMIIHNGKIVYYNAIGYNEPEIKSPLQRDAIYRLASQTKAVTSVAIMMLYEEGKLLLDDPVSKYIPAFKGQQVLDKFNEADTTYTTVPAKSDITIRQLLTHTSGIGGYANVGSDKVNAIYVKTGIRPGLDIHDDNLLDAMNRLAKLPLVHQPGEKLTYAYGTELLGCLVEVISGMSLDQFFKTKIFDPLGMKDTYFHLPKEKAGRLIYLYEDKNNKLVKAQNGLLNDKKATPDYPVLSSTYYSGGAGLSGPIYDYAIFLQMLLNGGKYNGKRILARSSVRIMTTGQAENASFMGANKMGFGFMVVTEKASAYGPSQVGTFFSGGAFATAYWVDPKEKLVLLFYRQIMNSTHHDVIEKFRVMAYSAMNN